MRPKGTMHSKPVIPTNIFYVQFHWNTASLDSHAMPKQESSDLRLRYRCLSHRQTSPTLSSIGTQPLWFPVPCPSRSLMVFVSVVAASHAVTDLCTQNGQPRVCVGWSSFTNLPYAMMRPRPSGEKGTGAGCESG